MAEPSAHEFFGHWDERLVTTAIHAGHELLPAVARLLLVDARARRREEDPFTELIAERASGSRVVVHRSRFEVDLNRPRARAIYRTPDEAWRLPVWDGRELDAKLVSGSLTVYDRFYAELGERLDRLAGVGPFVVYDVHAYNHRRGGPGASASPAAGNPEANVGTGTLHPRFRPVVTAFMAAIASSPAAGTLDVRENIRFRGGELARWVHQRYPAIGCVLAVDFKKTFMDEWTGEPDLDRVAALSDALAGTRAPVLSALAGLPSAGVA